MTRVKSHVIRVQNASKLGEKDSPLLENLIKWVTTSYWCTNAVITSKHTGSYSVSIHQYTIYTEYKYAVTLS